MVIHKLVFSWAPVLGESLLLPTSLQTSKQHHFLRLFPEERPVLPTLPRQRWLAISCPPQSRVLLLLGLVRFLVGYIGLDLSWINISLDLVHAVHYPRWSKSLGILNCSQSLHSGWWQALKLWLIEKDWGSEWGLPNVRFFCHIMSGFLDIKHTTFNMYSICNKHIWNYFIEHRYINRNILYSLFNYSFFQLRNRDQPYSIHISWGN